MKTLILISAIFLIGCTSSFDPDPKPEASFSITGTNQTYYSSIDEYGSAEIYYNVKNIGRVDIDYYKVYFTVTLTNGSKVYGWDNGTGVNTGNTISDNTYINTMDIKISNVIITSYDLSSY